MSAPAAPIKPATAARRELARRHLARENFGDFCRYVTKGKFLLPDHLKLLIEKLEAVERGECNRLIISMPPRHGKSMTTSRFFPAWFLGRNPDKFVILCSYAATFAKLWGGRAKAVLAEHGQRLFGLGLKGDTKSKEEWEIAGHEGGMKTAGVGGDITGRGAHLLIIDDPVKNAEEAYSEVYREKSWEWYLSTAYSRLEPGGAIIVIQTRWHESDLAGRILEDAKNAEGEGAEEWEEVVFPALAEDDDILGRKEGEPLWRERYDVDRLHQIRAKNPYWWSALYQQRPTPLDGGVFKREWLQYYNPAALAQMPSGMRYATVDLAVSTKEHADYTVIMSWAWIDGALYLLDMDRRRLEGPDIVPAIRQAVERNQLAQVYIEKAGFQLALIQQARRERLPVMELIPDKDKVSRAYAAVPMLARGEVFLPSGAHWLSVLEGELLGFPNAAHDDACFVAGTLISTARGLVPIEDISIGDMVLTRRGYRRAREAGLTSIRSPIYEVAFGNGARLRGTARHPVFVFGKGWVAIKDLDKGDEVWPVSRRGTMSSGFALTESSFADTETTNLSQGGAISTQAPLPKQKRRLSRFTDTSGRSTTGQYPAVATSTTEMETRAITASTTLSALRLASTTWLTSKIATAKKCLGTLRRFVRLLLPGTDHRREGHGTAATLEEPPCREMLTQSALCAALGSKAQGPLPFALTSVTRERADSAAKTTSTRTARSAGSLSGQINTREQIIAPVVVLGVRAQGSATVYNLSVEDQPEYFANGVLVHNCDAFVYGLLKAPKDFGRVEFKKKPKSVSSMGFNRPAGW